MIWVGVLCNVWSNVVSIKVVFCIEVCVNIIEELCLIGECRVGVWLG